MSAPPTEPRPDADGEAFLDDLFEEMTEAMLNGDEFDLDARLADHTEMADSAHDLKLLARSVVGSRRSNGTAAPRRIGDFEILEELGRGASSIVYLARQESLAGRLVALKMMTAATLFSDRDRDRFAAEVRALARVRHPNVVAIYDVVELDGERGFVMEWLGGRSLAELIRRRAAFLRDEAVLAAGDPARLPRAEYIPFVCRMGVALASALTEVHEAGLLHRDVKPSNVLMRRDGTPVLSDFGLVHDEEASLHTRTGAFLGTLAYAAPEQIRGLGVDERSDVYGLGAALFHALTLAVPGQGRTPDEVLRHIEAAPVRVGMPHSADTRLPRDLRTVIEKALRPNPAARYRTPGEFAADLSRVLTLQPIEARPEGLVARAVKLCRRNRRVLFGAVAGVLVLGAVLVALWWFQESQAAEERRAQGFVRAARLALLDSDLRQRLGLKVLHGGGLVHRDHIRSAMQKAVGQYESALSIRPLELQERLEQLALRACVARLAGEAVDPDPQLVSTCPQTVAALRGEPSAEATELAAVDRRMLGLVHYLDGDLKEALETLEKLRSRAADDPFVDGLIGQILLALGEPARAYPRLLRVSDHFPQHRPLKLAAAEAAIGCGDTEVAARLVRELGDPTNAFETNMLGRFHGDLLWLRGDNAGAEATYRKKRDYTRLTQFWAASGAWNRAVVGYVNTITIHPLDLRLQRGLVFSARRWWEEKGRDQRREALRKSLAGSMTDVGYLFGVLAAVERAGTTLSRVEGRVSKPPFTVHGDADLSDRSARGTSSALDRLLASVHLRRLDLVRCLELPESVRDELVQLWLGGGSPEDAKRHLQQHDAWRAVPGDPFDLGDWKIDGPWRIVKNVSVGDYGPAALWGLPLEPIGDVDGDGTNDVVVHHVDVPRQPLLFGRCQVYGGKDGGALYSAVSGAPEEYKGLTIARVRDVDRDGCDDWMTWTMMRSSGEDFVTVHSGRDGRELHRIRAPCEGIGFGTTLVDIGDVTGDGLPEVAIAARGNQPGDVGRGCVFVFTLAGRKLYEVLGDGQHDVFGRHLASLGDIDGDGAGDFAVGAEREIDKCYVKVVSGKDGKILRTIREPRFPKATSMSVGSVSDLDGDGRRELVVGCNSLVPWDFPFGRCRVISTKTWQDLFDIEGSRPGDGFGEKVEGLGDVDGDGRADFAVTAWLDVSPRPSSVFVYSGADGALLSEIRGCFRLERIGRSPTGAPRFAALVLGSWTRYGARKMGAGMRFAILDFERR